MTVTTEINIKDKGYIKGRYKLQAKQYTAIESVVPQSQYLLPLFSLVNAVRAVMERVFWIKNPLLGIFTPPPVPKPNAFRRMYWIRNKITELVLLSIKGWATPLTPEGWLMRVPRAKFMLYKNAQIKQAGLPVDKSQSNVKSFIKIEKTECEKKKSPVFRVVSPRPPAYNEAIGRYIKHVEHDIYHAYDEMLNEGETHKSPTIAKGLNSREVADAIKIKWDSFDEPVAIGLDMSRFDQHIRELALKFEHGHYPMLYDHTFRAEIKRLFDMQLKTNCTMYTSDGYELKYTMDSRCSGDQNTGLGNIIIMMSLLIQLRKETEIRFKIIDNGDDCVLIMEKKDLQKFKDFNITAWMLDFGFDVTIEREVYVMEQIKFCQTNPVLAADGVYMMIRDPRVAIPKDFISVDTFKTDSEYRTWRKSVADGGLVLNQNMPIFEHAYKAFSKNCSVSTKKTNSYRLDEGGMAWLTKGVGKRAHVEMTDESRYSFWKAFSIAPEEQIRWEKYYDGVVIQALDWPAGFNQTTPFNYIQTENA